MLSTDAFEEFSQLCPIPVVFHPLILPSGPTVNDVLQFRGLPPITHETIPLSFGNSTSVLTEHNFHILRAMRVPPVKQLNELLHTATDALKRGCSTVQYSNPSGTPTPGSLAFPLWIILWWCRIHTISEAEMSWNEALGFLDQLKRKEPLAQELIARILVLHWNMEVPSALGGNSTTSTMTMTTLAHYCGQKWLKTCHLEQMTAILQRRLDNAGLQGVMIAEPTFFQSLAMKYRASDENENFPVSQRLIAGSLSRLGFAVCVRMDRGKTVLENQETGIWGNHWIALVVDTAEAKIRYSDSFDSPLPTEIIDILYWWLTRHGFDKFKIVPLPFTRQRDSFSCGILSVDTISHYFLPEIPLLSSNECIIGRLRMLKSILDFTDMPIIPASNAALTSATFEAISPSPIPESAPSASKPKTTAPIFKHRRPKSSVSIDPDAPKTILDYYMDRLVPKGVDPDDSTSSTSKRKRDGDDSDSDASDDAEFHFEDISDTAKRKDKNGKDVGGRPKDEMMEKLTVKAWKTYSSGILPKVKGYRCATPGCREFHTTRNKERVAKHVLRDCIRATDEMRRMVSAYFQSMAPSNQLKEMEEKIVTKTVATSSEVRAVKTLRLGTTGSGSANGLENDAETTQEPNLVERMYEQSTRKGREARNKLMDLKLVILFCAGGLPTSLAAQWYWADIWALADPKYPLPSRDRLDNKLIPSEQAAIADVQLKALRNEWNLTISFDGGTTTGREAFWTVNVSDMKRNVYLLEGREATGVSHTGVWIKDLVLEVMDWIGRERFSGATSDSTGSTHLCKKLLVEEVKTVIPNPDICHYISNLIKDVVRIDFFEATIKVVRGTIHFFHTSHMGIHEFKIARSDLNISRGLQAVGKTRFGTIIYSSKSVQRCTPAIQKVIERGKADFSKLADYFGAPNKSSGIHSIKALSFQSNLSQLVSVGTPATKSLACLESNDANAGDVCLFWHATIGEMIKIISDEENHFPNDVCEELLDIIHHRHNNLFVEGGTYYTPLYLAAAYLNPANLQSDVFKSEPAEKSLQDVQYPSVHKFASMYLGGLAAEEIKSRARLEFKKWCGRGADFRRTWKDEMLRYSQRQYPYNVPIDESQPFAVIRWFEKIIAGDLTGGQLLPHIAIKVYSVRVNSMPEERTVSKFTAMTPKQRSQLKVSTMTAITQIGQFYTNEHNARLRKEKGDKATSIRFSSVRKGLDQATHDKSLVVETPANDETSDEWLDADHMQAPTRPDKYAAIKTPINFASKRVTAMLAVSEGASSDRTVSEEKALPNQAAPGNDDDYTIDFDCNE